MSDAAQAGTTAEQQLSLRLRQQELVAAFGMFALQADDLDSVLDQACALAARGLETKFAKVLEYRPATQDLLLRNGVGWNPGVVGHVTLGTDLASPAGFALQTKIPVVSNHLVLDTRFRTPAVLLEHGIHRAINVIVDEPDAPFGVLEADSSDRDQFTTDDVAFLQALANVLAAAIGRDRQKAAERALLRDKDVLLQEVHHRIKNNLQLVQTMLHLQARSLPDGDSRSHLQDAAARIMSIAAVHSRLHEEGAVEEVELAPYLDGLLADIARSLVAAEAGRPITLDVEPIRLSAAQVVPAGLIAVEMVTNALKYGAGAIDVRVCRTPTGIAITVEDAGAGFPAEFDPQSRGSLGMRLIAALARTPDPITIQRLPGGNAVTVRVTFAAAAPARQP